MKTAEGILPEGYDPSKGSRFAVKAANVLEMITMAADAWSSYRKAPTPAALTIFFSNIVIALDEFSASIGIAKLMGLDLQPFRLATAVFEDAQQQAATGAISSDITGSMAGRVTLALRDARLTARQLVMDGRALRKPEKSLEYQAFCTDAATIYSSLALVAKLFRLNMRAVLKAANIITAHSQALSVQALETAPEPEMMVFASRVLRATIECRRNPTAGLAMVEALFQSLQGS